MPTIVETPGATNANSYVTRAQADTYFSERLHSSAWTSASGDTKDAALVWAAKLLDRTVRYNGSKTSSSQSMAWPRSGMVDESGNEIADTVIPQTIKDVQCELAMLLIGTDRSLENQASAQGLTSLRAGPVSLSFKDEIKVNVVPDTLMAMMPIEWLWSKTPYPVVVS